MMEWSKYSVENKYLPITGTFAFFLCIASFFFQSWLTFFVGVFIILLIYFNHLYMRKVGEDLFFNNKKVRGKYFPAEEGEWVLEFNNRGVPIMKAKLTVTFHDSVTPHDSRAIKKSSMYEVTVPFSSSYHQKTSVAIPFTAEKRGVSRIRKIELMIPHFFGFGETVLEKEFQSIQEALVYPQTLVVHNKHTLLNNKQGESPVSYSLFEDTLSPAGTREYHYSDSFNRIHWKASARKQSLQTKLYDKVTENGWNIAINIGDDRFITNNLEEILSGVADLAYFYVKQNIPFSVCINIRHVGNTPFYYIMPGTGREHLQKVLEAIAHIDVHTSVYPFEKMLDYYDSHLETQPFFLLAGQYIPEKRDIVKKIAEKGSSLYELMVTEQSASIVKKSFSQKRGIPS
ncbi:DUF58 domain-containing protein [Neobacillus sp. YX16]|uniref:DUF58 domain-containing protein n=1 Tax=Neobacillus sp. YX16 TaxID=3047874 RepID=UPI0024C38B3D|nr:DUF58 domain-containing protein [Neobacillus sp. YX16]WHZ00717.1 DUF58 domain-containing protein [Neobacillus sp. YX16]